MPEKESSNIRMHGDIAIASFDPLSPEELPTYSALKDGSAIEAGWMINVMSLPSVTASARRAIKGIKRDNLFGELDLNGGTLQGELILKDTTRISSEAELKNIFMDGDHTLVQPIFAPASRLYFGAAPQKREIFDYRDFDAFALVPGRYPTSKNHYSMFAPNLKKADPYSKSDNWKLFRGLFFRRPRRSSQQ
jgi:hypothetical protein